MSIESPSAHEPQYQCKTCKVWKSQCDMRSDYLGQCKLCRKLKKAAHYKANEESIKQRNLQAYYDRVRPARCAASMERRQKLQLVENYKLDELLACIERGAYMATHDHNLVSV